MTIPIDPLGDALLDGREAVALIEAARRRVGRAGRDDGALDARLVLVERGQQAAGDAAAEAVGVDDHAVDVEQRPAALPRHRADQPVALVGAQEVLAAAAQLARRLGQRGQRARAEQVGLDAVGGALERDDRVDGAAIAEVERADLQRHCRPSAERMPAGASVAGTSP